MDMDDAIVSDALQGETDKDATTGRDTTHGAAQGAGRGTGGDTPRNAGTGRPVATPAVPLVWAHRGSSAALPENTLPAFEQAARDGADGVELDIQLTRDGRIVVCHDETIDRTSDGTGFLKDFTLAQLRRLDFSATHPEAGRTPIPTMREVFETLNPTGLSINIELKTGVFDYPGIEEAICELTHEMGMQGRVIYSSFNHASIERIRRVDSDARTAFLCSDDALGLPDYAASHHVDALHPCFVQLRHPGFVEDCHRLGLAVNTWTVDREDCIRACARLGVDAIITNTPARTRRIVENTAYSPEFARLIEERIGPWVRDVVQVHDIYADDGVRLRVRSAVRDDERAAVVIVHGFCEFFGKYQILARRLYDAGYSVFFVELRGHGDSGRSKDYHDSRVGVGDFSEYVGDVKAAVDQVARPMSRTKRLLLLSHSMGGCVGALYLERHPEDFSCAVLSSPMIRMNTGRVPHGLVQALSGRDGGDGAFPARDDDYAPGQGPFNPFETLEGSSGMDPDRFERQAGMRLENANYRTWGATWGWVKAGVRAGREAVRDAGSIRVPVLLCQAGADTMVDNQAQNEFAMRAPGCSIVTYTGAKHELYNGTTDIRNQWFDDVVSFFREHDGA